MSIHFRHPYTEAVFIFKFWFTLPLSCQLQDAVINELKKRQVNEGNKKLQEVYHGALEDILSDLKNEPYRRADALRRSQRRKVDATRMSRNFEDLDV